ncbi:hypothetical protein M0802_000786 [Mischocyttarus mexicanus]|nr:hypothetical protein M0802_000786 [Mischocyttarus mexicanus]
MLRRQKDQGMIVISVFGRGLIVISKTQRIHVSRRWPQMELLIRWHCMLDWNHPERFSAGFIGREIETIPTSITTVEFRSFSMETFGLTRLVALIHPVFIMGPGLKRWYEVHEFRNGLCCATIGIRSSIRPCVISVIDSDSVPQCSRECAFMVTHILGDTKGGSGDGGRVAAAVGDGGGGSGEEKWREKLPKTPEGIALVSDGDVGVGKMVASPARGDFRASTTKFLAGGGGSGGGGSRTRDVDKLA